MFSSLIINLFIPLFNDANAIRVCAKGTPIFLKTVLSVKSLCKREIGSLLDKNEKIAFPIPKLPSAFSKSIGFTLCGIADEPTSPFFIFCLK